MISGLNRIPTATKMPLQRLGWNYLVLSPQRCPLCRGWLVHCHSWNDGSGGRGWTAWSEGNPGGPSYHSPPPASHQRWNDNARTQRPRKHSNMTKAERSSTYGGSWSNLLRKRRRALMLVVVVIEPSSFIPQSFRHHRLAICGEFANWVATQAATTDR